MNLYRNIAAGIARVVGLVSPLAALRYTRAQNALLAYNGASLMGARSEWRPSNRSADAILWRDRFMLTARARDLDRNSAIIKGALDKICANVIFLGLLPQVDPELYGEEKADLIEKLWWKWATSPEINYLEMQRLVLRSCYTDGEIISRLRPSLKLLERGRVPLRVDLIETDQVNGCVDGAQANGSTAVRGIEYDSEGDPQAFHILRSHPGNYGAFGYGIMGSGTWLADALGGSVRVPAAQIIHTFRRTRASQSRGVPWLHAIIEEMGDFTEYQSSERLAARLTSAFGIFMETDLGADLGDGSSPIGTPGDGPSDFQNGKIPTYIDPGSVTQLPAGVKLSSAQFNRPGGSYEPFTKTSLRNASTAMGMSFEAFSNNYTDASFASARSASLEERRAYQVQQEFLVQQFCTPLWKAWCSMLAISGLVPGLPEEIEVTWQRPGWSWVDPKADAMASDIEVSMGINSRTNICAERGRDPAVIWKQLKREKQDLEGLLPPPPSMKGVPDDSEGGNDASQDGKAPQK